MRYLVISDIHANLEALDTVLEAATALGWRSRPGPRRSGRLRRRPERRLDRVRALAPHAHHPRQPRQGGRRHREPPRASTPWPAAPSAGPTTRSPTTTARGSRRCPPGRCWSTTLRDLPRHAVRRRRLRLRRSRRAPRPARRAAAALPVRPHPRPGRLQHPAQSVRAWRPRTTRGRSTSRWLPEARYLINPGSVGQPRDGDPRAGFAIVDTERAA